MVSRRTYITLMLLMGIIFFLFVSTGVAKDRWNDYQSNPYIEEGGENFSAGNVWDESRDEESSEGSSEEVPGEDRRGDGVIYLGDLQKDDVGDAVRQWCFYTKRTLHSYTSLSDWPGREEEMPEVLLIEPDYLGRGDVTSLTVLAERGVSMVFCHLPEVETIKSDRALRELLGIKKVKSDSCMVKGYKLYGGFLLGEETHYIAERPEDEKRQDMTLETPWYQLDSGTKLYMVGMLDGVPDKVKNEELPAILWRAAYGDAKIFAVNGTYMEDISGMGVLSAMMSELHDYELYPVVNAQNFVVVNGPDLTSENTKKMQEIYSRSTRLMLRDLVFPNLAAISGVTGFPMTCMATMGLDSAGEDASYDDFIYYLKWLREQKAEVGISLAGRTDTSLRKTSEDFWKFLKENDNRYLYSAMYIPHRQLSEGAKLFGGKNDTFTGVQTIVSKETGDYRLLDYISDTVTIQGLTDSAFSHTYTADFQLRAMETGLGYSSVYLDLEQVVYPENNEEHWEKLSEQFSSNLNTYWKPFSAFEKTVLAESDRRVRQFLALDYENRRNADTIELKVENLKDEAWFVLRTHGEDIAEITGATWEQIEKDAYLLTVTEPRVTIKLEEETSLYYYE